MKLERKHVDRMNEDLTDAIVRPILNICNFIFQTEGINEKDIMAVLQARDKFMTDAQKVKDDFIDQIRVFAKDEQIVDKH